MAWGRERQRSTLEPGRRSFDPADDDRDLGHPRQAHLAFDGCDLGSQGVDRDLANLSQFDHVQTGSGPQGDLRLGLG